MLCVFNWLTFPKSEPFGIYMHKDKGNLFKYNAYYELLISRR